MIESEILEIVRDPQRLDSLTDEFRCGRDVGELLELLNSDNDEIVGIGVWIAGEVKIAPVYAQPVIFRLHQLVNHENPSIRFRAIGALFPFLDRASPAVKKLLMTLSCDPNEGVRLIAEAAMKRFRM